MKPIQLLAKTRQQKKQKLVKVCLKKCQKCLPGGVRGQQRNPSHVALQNPEKKEEFTGNRNRTRH
jgi:hypothetical protein